MTRQLEVEVEERETRRRDALVKALDYGLVGALSQHGVELLGLAAKWDAWDCLITLKAEVGGVRSVAFVGSDSLINALIKCARDASQDKLKWRQDKYHEGGG